jgi:hypothetical protein
MTGGIAQWMPYWANGREGSSGAGGVTLCNRIIVPASSVALFASQHTCLSTSCVVYGELSGTMKRLNSIKTGTRQGQNRPCPSA